jgi:glycerophosphoryl diester phosphodiesterase
VSRSRPASDFPYFDNDGLPLAFAHRGGALSGDNVGLENSMVAFQTAVDLGYRYIETDVHVTRDGALLAFHDATLDRATDGTGPIAERTRADLRSVLIDGREPIPLLADILTSWPDLKVNIDAKSPASAVLLGSVIRQQRAEDRVCVASFSAARIRVLRHVLGPRVPTSFSAPGVGALRLLPGTCVQWLSVAGRAQAAQVPVRKGALEIVTADFVSRAHRLGTQVHVWTIDAPDDMRRLLDLGVDGIMTDRIDLLREVYRERGVWPAG